MLEARDGAVTQKEDLPIGFFYKKLIDKKYRNVVELKADLADNIVFCERLKRDCELSAGLNNKSQLRFIAKEDSSGIYELELEQGNYLTFEQLLEQNPAVVAGKDFINDTVKRLVDITQQLHAEGVYQLCYAPQSVFARKSDNMPLLLTHGSFYHGVSDVENLYEGYERYVAPEVLAGEQIDERSDVFALARFIERLYDKSDMPIEYKRVLKKATSEEPDNRFHDIDGMMRAMKLTRTFSRGIIGLIAAIILALIAFFIYQDLTPQKASMEYIEAVQQQQENELDKGFDPLTELALVETDSLGNELTPEQRQLDAEYQAKAEQIFRKRYTKEAERILSKLYKKENMNQSEQNFLSLSRESNEELVKLQVEIGNEADLSNTKSQQLASEIIETVTNRYKKEMGVSYGYQRPKKEE